MTLRRPLLLALALLAGCDRSPPVARVTPVAPIPRGVTVQSIAAFDAGIETKLVAVPGKGTLYVCQTKGDGRDTVFVLRPGELPRATALTAPAVAKLLGWGDQSGGEIQGLALLPGDRLAFYFVGTAGRRTACAAGVFDPRDDSIRIRAGTADLARVSGAGDTLLLLHGTFVATNERVILWLRGVSGSTFLSFDPARLAGTDDVVLTRPFVNLTLDAVPYRPPAGAWLTPADGAALGLTVPSKGITYRIDRDGRLTVAVDHHGRPMLTAPPLYVGDAPVIFYPGGEVTFDQDSFGAGLSAGQYPILTGPPPDDARPFLRDQFRGPAGFPAYALRFTAIVAGQTPGELIGYDATSGEVLRLTTGG